MISWVWNTSDKVLRTKPFPNIPFIKFNLWKPLPAYEVGWMYSNEQQMNEWQLVRKVEVAS